MQLHGQEREAHDLIQAFAHESRALVSGERVIAEVSAAKRSEHDMSEVDDARHSACIPMADQKSTLTGLGHALDVRAECGRRCRWGHPRTMKRGAGTSGSDEFALVRGRWRTEDDS